MPEAESIFCSHRVGILGLPFLSATRKAFHITLAALHSLQLVGVRGEWCSLLEHQVSSLASLAPESLQSHLPKDMTEYIKQKKKRKKKKGTRGKRTKGRYINEGTSKCS